MDSSFCLYCDKCLPGTASSTNRTVLVVVANHHADDSGNQDEHSNNQSNDDGGPVLAPTGGLLAGVHDGRAAAVANVVRLHDRARGRRVVAVHLGEVRDGLRHRHDRELGQRVRYRLGVLRLAVAAGRGAATASNIVGALLLGSMGGAVGGAIGVAVGVAVGMAVDDLAGIALAGHCGGYC